MNVIISRLQAWTILNCLYKNSFNVPHETSQTKFRFDSAQNGSDLGRDFATWR